MQISINGRSGYSAGFLQIKKALNDNGFALADFLDIHGAFYNTRTSILEDSARKHIIDYLICEWFSRIGRF